MASREPNELFLNSRSFCFSALLVRLFQGKMLWDSMQGRIGVGLVSSHLVSWGDI